MPRDIFRALHPSFVEHEHSGCFEGTSKLGPRRMHLGFCFDATGLREVYATIGSTILPETAGTLADVIAELDRAFGPNSDRVHWASATTQAEILREEQSGPYLWLYSVRLAPRATP